MLDDFFVRALLAGVGVACATGPLGSFVVWRRMAYFGDAVAHAAILGVALAIASNLPIALGTLITALAMGLVVSALTERGHAMDSVLGVLAHGALALGLVAISFVPGVRVDLSAFLFGDILAVGKSDLLVIWGGAALICALLAWRWSALITVTLNVDLAHASGINPKREALVLTLALAVVVALAIKVVGALLIAALLIIPAVTARSFSRTPEVMAIGAVGIGALASILGLHASLQFDTPAGPSIVVAGGVLFVLSLMWRR
ncbi:metal ABC transporter permease [Cochlodiniinecator piscidefendens]|uniref:metal ABC transporter permease n=1 Tax=Cochlodiniinecator piscidefendens TaxID=2715756 RepID=UPI0014088FCF|nr:metal ABC transporter permease [Cochlodiniinecator piscidefendens]